MNIDLSLTALLCVAGLIALAAWLPVEIELGADADEDFQDSDLETGEEALNASHAKNGAAITSAM